MQKAQLQVQQFHREILNGPTSPAEPKLRNPHLRARLILEEAIETAVALVGSKDAQNLVHEQLLKVLQETAKAGGGEPNVADAIDGCIDVLVVTYGTLEDIGVDGEPFFDEVMRANFAKANGPVRADGKKLKPPGWTPPDIAGVLKKMLDEREYAAQLEREPPDISQMTPERWRELTPMQRDGHHNQWHKRLMYFTCIGCGYPAGYGCSACDACREHPEIRFESAR